MINVKKRKEDKKSFRILFYIANPFIFRTAAIGYLYELSQVYQVFFFSEELDSETGNIILNKRLFPRIEKIVPIRQFTGKKRNLFFQNSYLYKLTKDAIENYKPDVIICSSDTHSLFELYLMRLAKRKKILKIALQTANIAHSDTLARKVDLTNAYSLFPKFLPLFFKFFLAKCRKYVGHLIYYWFLPLIVGEAPFFGKSSYILYIGISGMRDTDFQTVFSDEDYKIYLKEGVPAEKLKFLRHPLKSETREFFRKNLWQSAQKEKKNQKIITVLLPEDEIGFERKKLSLISKEKMEKTRVDIINLIVKILNNWTIFLKPHPDIKDIKTAIKPFKFISSRIKILDFKEPADKYIGISDAILELPLAAGTTIFTAALQCPEKPIIALDFNKELLGNHYKDFEGIEYIDNKEKLINILELIKDEKYQKKIKAEKKSIGFSNIVNLLEDLLKNH